MRAITLWQPWAHLVALRYKRVENRSWAPPSSLIGKDFAIHAGKKWDSLGLDLVKYAHGSVPDKNDVVFGSIIAVAKIYKVVGSDGPDAISELEMIAPGQERWFVGPFGWILNDIRPITPIPCRGMQKLWDLPDDVEKQVLESLR